MEIEDHSNTWEGYVDYKFRPALRGRHGGMLAASFLLVAEVLENMAFLANSSNLVRYLSKMMNLSPSSSANNVTNFMATAFLLALLGGFFSDAFFTCYYIYLISAVVEFVGLVILTTQASSPSLRPTQCGTSNPRVPCEELHGGQALMLFFGLYLTALGVGGIKGSLPALGAEQFDEHTPEGRKQISTFFNYFVFCLSCGGLIAVTFVLWIEDNMGWQWGFGIATLAILFSILAFLAGSRFYRSKIPRGSPLTTIFKVLLAALLNTSRAGSLRNEKVGSPASPSPLLFINLGEQAENGGARERKLIGTPSKSLGFLNRAVENKPALKSLECSVDEVEDVKVVLRILPIFACTIMLNCCLAQLSTFSVHQAATMNTKLGSFVVPPASLPIFPILFIIILAPLYDGFIVPYASKLRKSEMGISHLQRIGAGLVLSVIAMAVAALVETKRKRIATEVGPDATHPLPITFFWIAFQYLFLGSADLFSLAGLLEFSFTEAPISMRSLATSLSWASLAMGYYLSSVIVSLVNTVTKHRPWLMGENINRYQLERFYWMMCALSVLNFVQYLFWTSRYKYRSTTTAA